ncbi:MAG: DEAD/DEAH box helicase [Bacteroidota bacterium]
MDIKTIISSQKEKLRKQLSPQEIALGEIIFNSGQCQILTQSATQFELIVSDEMDNEVAEFLLQIEEDGTITPKRGKETQEWDKYAIACLLQAENEMYILNPKEHIEHKKYTRQGMIKRVLTERRQKAEKAEYRIRWADNIYGDHILTNEKGIKYKVFLRDFENETGYSDSMDARLNKLGTTKHIMFAFRELKENKSLFQRLKKTYPFVEVFCDPLNDYKITWYYPHNLPVEEQLLISRYFKNSNVLEDNQLTDFLPFIEEAAQYPHIHIRPEVAEKIEAAYENEMLISLRDQHIPDFCMIDAELYPYQKEGVEFALFRKNAIIADEMGLGKTIQAITTAILKKQIFGFTKTLVVCPASLKEQWQKEVEKFTNEKALVVQGFPDERAEQYKKNDCFIFIVNYETVLRDQRAINKAGFDFIILDEAQRAKNYETKTASSLKRLEAKHKLAITGTPIENRLIDIFSVMGILDPTFLGPLWEFSYQHCLFDPDRHNKINGYYNLQKLNKQLEKVLLRREKRKVIDQLPNLQQIDIAVNLSPLQADYHGSYARGLASILRKKFLTPYDMQKMQLLLASMRMVCDSTYLIDDETNESPKLEELEHILIEKLDVRNKNTKIIIFSEWVKVHKLIGRILRENNIGFVELNGRIPVKSRGELIRKFEQNPQYKIFLSTEAGGSGLNLQVADTLINFELPWNPAKKNQRIGRIDRIGQKSKKLTIYNFITRNSIEEKIASGLLVKQSLFDNVLGENATTNFVDFSTKGRSQFIKQLEEFVTENEQWEQEKEEQPELQGEMNAAPENVKQGDEIDLSDDSSEQPEKEVATTEPAGEGTSTGTSQTEEFEKVMNNGMEFLSGLYKMATGKEMGMDNKKIKVNKETGEVTMTFKLPI